MHALNRLIEFDRSKGCIALLLALVPLMVWHHAIATIPTPSDIRLEPGYLRWSNSQWAIELESGRIVRTNRPDVIIDEDGKLFGIDYLNDTEQLAVSIDVPGTTQPTRRVVVDLWGLPTILSGRYLILESSDRLRAVDLESDDLRVVTAMIGPASPLPHLDESASLIPIRGTNRFLREDYNSTQGQVALYQIEPDQIRLLNSWQGLGQIYCCNGRIYINRQRDNTVDVRSAADGSLIETIPFPMERNKIRPNSFDSLVQDWVIFSDSQATEFICFDLSRKAIVDLPDKQYCPWLSDRSSYVVLFSDVIGKAGEFLIYDRQKGTVVQTVQSPLPGARFTIHDETHLLLTSNAHGISAVLMDMLTGREVERWTPYAWTSWSTWLFCPLMLLWTIAWCRASARLKLWAWVDIAMIGGLLLTMAAYRSDFSSYSHVTLLPCATLLLSLVQFVGWVVMLQRRHIVASVSMLFLTLGVAQSLYVQVIAQYAYEHRGALLFASAISLLCIACVGGIVRWTGRSMRGQDTKLSSVSIYDFMILMAAMAVFANSLRVTTSLSGPLQDLGFVRFLLTSTVLGVVGLFVGLLPNRRMFIAVLGLACLGAAIVVGYRVVELMAGDSPLFIMERFWCPTLQKSESYVDALTYEFPEVAEAAVIGLFTPFLATIPFRLRGWKLCRHR